MAVDISKGEHYATAYSLKGKDLYTNFFKNHKLRVSSFDIQGYDGYEREILGNIFIQFMQLVIEDVIENQVTFKLPFKGAYIEMVPISGDKFREARQNGAFEDIDFLTSNFTGYQIYLRLSNRYGKRYKHIHVTKRYKDRITELTNKGIGW